LLRVMVFVLCPSLTFVANWAWGAPAYAIA